MATLTANAGHDSVAGRKVASLEAPGALVVVMVGGGSRVHVHWGNSKVVSLEMINGR